MREMVEGPAKLTNPSESLLIIYKQGGHQHQTVVPRDLIKVVERQIPLV